MTLARTEPRVAAVFAEKRAIAVFGEARALEASAQKPPSAALAEEWAL